MGAAASSLTAFKSGIVALSIPNSDTISRDYP